MEEYSARTVLTDDFTSSETADTGGSQQSACDGASHTACFLPSLPVSVSSDETTLAFEDERSQADEASSALRPPEELLIMRINIETYYPLTAHGSWSLEGSHDGAVEPPENVEYPTATSGSKWRPKYLRRWVLIAFSAAFLFMIAVLELLSAISARNDGIAKGFNKDHYLWTYGPTAFLTLIAALFNRVEYQAKVLAPWERLSKGPAPARKTLLLDYVSPLQPVAIYESLKNKDFAVAATATISVLIKLLIVLSSGLITLSRVGVHHSTIPMEIQDAFVDDNSLLGAGSTVPYFILQGLIEGSSYPPGISSGFAFQSVRSQLPDTAQYQVVVDGLTTSLECEIAELDVFDFDYNVSTHPQSVLNLTIRSPGCEVGPNTYLGPDLWSQDMPIQLAVGRFQPVYCKGGTLQPWEAEYDTNFRILIMFGLEEWITNETIPIEPSSPDCNGSNCGTMTVVGVKMLESAQLLCTPKHGVTKVNVVKNGTEVQSVTPVHTTSEQYSNRTLTHVRPWSFAQAYFDAINRDITTSNDSLTAFNVSQGSLFLDARMYSLVERQLTAGTNLSSLYDPNFVQSLATTYYQQAGAVIAKQLLLKPTSFNITGSAIVMDDRLIMREWAVQWMVGVIAICTILSLFSAFIIPQTGILHRNPNTLPGMAALVAQSPDLLEQLRYSGDAVSKTLRLQLQGPTFHSEVIRHPSSGLGEPNQSFVIKDVLAENIERPYNFFQSESTHHHPWILHPASRLGLGLFLLALVVTFEVTLHQSRSHDGLGDVVDNAYMHYTWTSIPTLVLGGLAMIISSIDLSIRSLAPYTSLSNVVSAAAFGTLHFLDMSVPSAIIKETKLRNIGALATTTTLLFASFYTVFSGSLFQGVSLPSTTLALLRANNSFGPTGNDTSFGINAPLILLGNLSYPSFTYEDLAFPQLLPTMALTTNESSASLLSVNAVVPALRPHLECHLYDKSKIRVEIDHWYSSASHNPSDFEGNSLKVAVNEEGCPDRGDISSFNTALSIPSNASYFGVGATSDSFDNLTYPIYPRCHDYLFVWGKLVWGNWDPDTEVKLEHITAMHCNQSIETVDVETNFIGADLAIDMDNPPQPVPGSERTSTAALDPHYDPKFLYANVPNIPTDEILSSFFALLTQSRWAIPLSTLGGGSDEAVAAAIKFQHGVFVAQALNERRMPAIQTDATLTPEQALAGENDAGRTFEATVVDKRGRQRVVQDAISTRVLEALLLLTLVLLGVGWVWLPKTNVLPKRSPMTIASVVALLAGGNLEEWVHEMDRGTTGVCGERGATMRFWMGWGNVPDEEGILMGNENENGISRFGIFAVRAADVDEK